MLSCINIETVLGGALIRTLPGLKSVLVQYIRYTHAIHTPHSSQYCLLLIGVVRNQSGR